MQRHRTTMVVIAVFVTLGITLVFTSRSSALSPDEQAIEQVVTQAETAELTLPDLHTPPTNDAQVQSALTQATSVLDSLYSASSSRLATRLEQVRRVLEGDKTQSLIELGSGINDVNFGTVAITGTLATVQLTFTSYADFTVRQPNGQVFRNTPSGKMIGDLGLVKTGQGWRITDEINSFAPGYGP